MDGDVDNGVDYRSAVIFEKRFKTVLFLVNLLEALTATFLIYVDKK